MQKDLCHISKISLTLKKKLGHLKQRLKMIEK